MINNLEYYKVFYYVAKAGGITNAAEHLSISQPAVSQAVKQLETAVGTKLFIRTPKGAKLTAEGRLLYSYIERAYETIEVGELKLKEAINLENGEIRIGASDMTLRFYLLPFLEKFHEKHPKIKVIVYNSPTPEIIHFMQEGKIDFGVVSAPIQAGNEIVVKEVKEIEDIFVAGSKFLHLKNKRQQYKKLENIPIICLEHNTSTRKYINEFLLSEGVILAPEFELAISDMIVQFAVRNLGIGCVMGEFAKSYIDRGELFQLSFTNPIPKRNLCIITNRKHYLSSAAKGMLSTMK